MARASASRGETAGFENGALQLMPTVAFLTRAPLPTTKSTTLPVCPNATRSTLANSGAANVAGRTGT
eukprot:7465292-Lingulodinium_polyedra.AAC.1